MKRFLALLFATILFGCASSATIINPQDTASLPEFAINNAKNVTTMISRLSMSGRTTTKDINNQIKLTTFWFVTGDGMLSDSKGLNKFKSSLGKYCKFKSGVYIQHGTKGKIEYTDKETWIWVEKFNYKVAKDKRAFINECISDTNEPLFTIALNYGDQTKTAGNTIVSKVRVAIFENNGSYNEQKFRFLISSELSHLVNKWASTY